MRRVGLLSLLLVAALALAVVLGLDGHGRSRPSAVAAASIRQTEAERVLTLLDVWSQTLVPNIVLQQSRARALQVGNVSEAARLERRVRRGLRRAEGFEAVAAYDPALRNSSVEVRALRVAAAAWGDWAAALLMRPTSSSRHDQAKHVAELEAKAIRLHQAAYAVVDASLRAALETR